MRILYLILLSAFLFAGCDLSQGLQRQKLEFLYKLNSRASLVNEFTYEIQNYSLLELYHDRLNKLNGEISGMNNIEGWDRSAEIKAHLTGLIKDNLKVTDSLLVTYKSSDSLKVKDDKAVQSMKLKVEDYLMFLEKEIAAVEKE